MCVCVCGCVIVPRKLTLTQVKIARKVGKEKEIIDFVTEKESVQLCVCVSVCVCMSVCVYVSVCVIEREKEIKR